MNSETGKTYFQNGYGVTKFDKEPNMEHISTINGGNPQGVPTRVIFVDKRKVNPSQRALYYALIGDIVRYSGEDKDYLDDYFRELYWEMTYGKSISLSDTTENSVSDARMLIDLVVDFIFEYDVPVKAGYELLPRDEEYFQYKCLMNQRCLICGQHSDFHHVDTVGMGRDRNKIDHTKHRVMALCRTHHTEYHKIGSVEFCRKYHLTAPGIRLSVDDLKRLKIRGNYEQTTN